VSCQPSELERCVVTNAHPTPTNNYMTKYKQHNEIVISIFRDKSFNNEEEQTNAVYAEVRKYKDSLNPLEKIVDECVNEVDLPTDLTPDELGKLFNQTFQSCLSSTKKKVKKLQQKIEAENKEKAQSICNSQGIY